jgi:hypothetical protein
MTRVLLAEQARTDPAVRVLVSHLAANFSLRIRSDHNLCRQRKSPARETGFACIESPTTHILRWFVTRTNPRLVYCLACQSLQLKEGPRVSLEPICNVARAIVPTYLVTYRLAAWAKAVAGRRRMS